MDRNMLLQNKLTHSHKTSRKFRAEQYWGLPARGGSPLDHDDHRGQALDLVDFVLSPYTTGPPNRDLAGIMYLAPHAPPRARRTMSRAGATNPGSVTHRDATPEAPLGGAVRRAPRSCHGIHDRTITDGQNWQRLPSA